MDPGGLRDFGMAKLRTLLLRRIDLASTLYTVKNESIL